MIYEKIEEKYKELINIAKQYMHMIVDKEHDIHHVEDVVNFTKNILSNINEEADVEACIIGAYWHDVGRTKIQQGHEKVSAEMLKETMKQMNYDELFIEKCYNTIEFHKWNMNPKTIEGLIIKDADKLAWVGSGRWKTCIQSHQSLEEIITLLPKLRNEILYFDYSRKIYDKEIVKIVEMLHNEIYKNNVCE